VLLFDERRELAVQAAWSGWPPACARRPSCWSRAWWRRITALGMEEDSARLEEADWVCEAIPELLEAKQALFHAVAPIVRPGTLLSTNTSGLARGEPSRG
jgi:hypothetical protein